jgi:hypothetical protein
MYSYALGREHRLYPRVEWAGPIPTLLRIGGRPASQNNDSPKNRLRCARPTGNYLANPPKKRDGCRGAESLACSFRYRSNVCSTTHFLAGQRHRLALAHHFNLSYLPHNLLRPERLLRHFPVPCCLTVARLDWYRNSRSGQGLQRDTHFWGSPKLPEKCGLQHRVRQQT